jgi:hypothetical protein
MMRSTIKASIASIIILALVGAGGFFLHWHSTPQRLERACWQKTLDALVSPASAKIADFRILAPGSPSSVIGAKLRAASNKADKELFDAKQADVEAKSNLAKADKISTENSKRGESVETASESFDLVMSATNASVKAFEASMLAENNAKLAKSTLESFLANGLGEIVIELDAQNRASAMLRMTSVCTYLPKDSSDVQVASVSGAQIEQR